MNQISYSVLNAIASGAADVSLAARKLKVSNDALNGTVTPELLYPSIDKAFVYPSVVEQPMSFKIEWTTGGAANTKYTFLLTQFFKEKTSISSRIVATTPAGSAFNDVIGDGLALQINSSKQLFCIATHGSGQNYIIVTAKAALGCPIISCTGGLNVVITENMLGVAVASTTVANPSVLTSTAHGLKVGSVIDLVSGTPANLASGRYIVAPTSYAANTFSLVAMDGTTTVPCVTGTVTATVTKVANYPNGQGVDLVNGGVAEAESGAIYRKYLLIYDSTNNRADGANASQHALYVKEAASNTSAAYNTNFATFNAELNNKLKGVIVDSASNTATVGAVAVTA